MVSATQVGSVTERADVTRTLVEALDQLYREELGCKGDIPLHEPWFRGNEWTYLKECLDTGWVSSVGSFVDRFERDLARRCGAGFAVATTN